MAVSQPVALDSPSQPATATRLASLDVFRGATIAAMILVNNPGSGADSYAPLRHAEWHGWTPTDLIFPFFLWIAGVAMTLSFAARVERGQSRQALMLHTLRRAAIIFALGLLLNGFPNYDLATLRIPGVLQRIAVCYAAAGLIYLYTTMRGQIAFTGALLAVYWVLMRFVPVPGFGAGVLVKNGNFAQYIDQMLLSGHMYAATKNWDPEGIVSTLPAIATVLFGILAGHLLRSQRTAAERTVWMFIAGGALIVTGQILDNWLPINKNLWTSSYSIFTAGLAFQSFGAAYWLADVIRLRTGTRFCVVFGMNAIAAYVLSGLIARLAGMSGLKTAVYDGALAPLLSPSNASLAWALLNVAVCYAAALLLYRRGWFIKV